MADYYSLISRAISALPGQTPDARQGVYERARKALVNQLRSIQPPVAEADIAAESRALEEAITRLEIELARANAQGARTKTAAPAKPAPTGKPEGAPPPPTGAAASATTATAPARAAEPAKSALEPQPAPRSAEDAWRDTLADTAPAANGREPQRPAAPLPRPPRSQRPSGRTVALAGVVVSLIAVVGALAWYLRERPEDLAKLKPAETGAKGGAEGGKFGERVEGGAPTGGPKRVTTVPVAQKAELWVASLQEPDKVDRIYNANVVWRLENIGGGPGQPVSSAIRGDVDVPEAKLKLSLLFQKNTDSALSASHTVNISFKPQPGTTLGNVKAIGPIQMRRPDAQSGEKIVGIPVPITENNFLIGLMRGDREMRNIQLLRSLSVLDLPIQFADGRPATINMEKGASGERVFADAIDSWSR
ncbi:hypothetical protein [Methylocystis echinoides]|uniref:Uncharacterized protein n=1 Tax=Methylocystis echinoides TaxID=29468 RepID=A0A9W6GUL3_9HYPH|nr:hypothetical protein [Methylocystis echinoides]GLI93196.1 hypothetical protein LMG27198_21880 [Methylocystis echinoides]